VRVGAFSSVTRSCGPPDVRGGPTPIRTRTPRVGRGWDANYSISSGEAYLRTGTTGHRPGYNRDNGPSSRFRARQPRARQPRVRPTPQLGWFDRCRHSRNYQYLFD
jgi:hypothetical protein